MGQQSIGTNAIFAGTKLNRFSGTVAQCTALDDWNADNFDHTGLGFIGGGNIAMRMEAYPIATSRVVPPGAPRWGSAYKAYLKDNATSIAAGINQHDTLPYDPDGVPLLRVTQGLKNQERLRVNHVAQKAMDLYKAAGATTTWVSAPSAPQASTHAVGGLRIGNDPSTSVVNGFGIAPWRGGVPSIW